MSVKRFLAVSSGAHLCYRVDDYTDPWRRAETVVFVHGFGESGQAWRAWVPHLARRYRVVRYDQRGFGDSTPMAVDFPWSLEVLVTDLECVVHELCAEPVHLVGAKIAGPVVLRFAASRPELTRSVTVVGSMAQGPQHVDGWVRHIEQRGVADWARATMGPRLGSALPAAAVEWWIELMSATAQSTALGLMPVVPQFDVTPDLGRIRCPVRVIATDTKQQPADQAKAWQKLIPNSRLVVLPGDAYHAAASDPDSCARITREFLDTLSE